MLTDRESNVNVMNALLSNSVSLFACDQESMPHAVKCL